MSSRLRRFEILLPLQFNDGTDVPDDLLAQAVLEIIDHFGAVSYESQGIEGHWRYQDTIYRDNLSKIVIDVPDSDANRDFMISIKESWKERFRQIDIWLVSYIVDVD